VARGFSGTTGLVADFTYADALFLVASAQASPAARALKIPAKLNFSYQPVHSSSPELTLMFTFRSGTSAGSLAAALTQGDAYGDFHLVANGVHFPDVTTAASTWSTRPPGPGAATAR
jgi:hypothetical protein